VQKIDELNSCTLIFLRADQLTNKANLWYTKEDHKNKTFPLLSIIPILITRGKIMKNKIFPLLITPILIAALSMVSCGGSSGGSTPATDAVSINDLDGSTDVARDATFIYTFSEAINTSTVTDTTFFLVEGEASSPPEDGGEVMPSIKASEASIDIQTCDAQYALPATVACSTSTACTITPSSELNYNLLYTICILDDIQLASGTAFEGLQAVFTSVASDTAFTAPAPEVLTFAAYSSNNANAGFAVSSDAYLINWSTGKFYKRGSTEFGLYYTSAADTIDLLQTFSTEVLDANAHIISGLKDDGNLCQVPSGDYYNCATTETWVYNPDENTLVQGAAVNNARDVAASGVVDGKIYILGGWDPNPDDDNLSSVEVYDGTTWSEVTYTGRFTAVRSPAYATVGKKIYVMGGCVSPLGCQQTLVQIFDTETNSFSSGADMSLAGRHFSGQHAVTRQNRYIYVYGGATDMSEIKFDYVAVYDTEANEWQTLTNTMTEERKSCGSVMIDDELYVSGGGPDSTEVGTFTAVP